MDGINSPPDGVTHHLIPKLAQQDQQFIQAAVHIANRIERTRFETAIGQQWHSLDARRSDLLLRTQVMDRAETLTLQSAQALA